MDGNSDEEDYSKALLDLFLKAKVCLKPFYYPRP